MCFISKHYSIQCVGHCKHSTYLCEVPEGYSITAYFFYLTSKQNRHMYQLFECKTCNYNLFFMHCILFNIFKLNANHPPCSAPFENNFYRHRKKTHRKHICLGHFYLFFLSFKETNKLSRLVPWKIKYNHGNKRIYPQQIYAHANHVLSGIILTRKLEL